MVELETVELRVDGLRLTGALFVPPGPGPHPGLIICHGLPQGAPPANGDSGYPGLAQRFCGGGFAVLIFNFRGTGESQGNFDILGWARDLECATDYLWDRQDVDWMRVYVLGSSAGGAVALYGASWDRRLAGVVAWAAPARWDVLVNPQAFLQHARSIGIVRDANFPTSVAQWAYSFEEVTPERWVKRIAPRPILIVHGDADDVVAPEQARKLYEVAGEPKELFILPGVGHRLRLEEQAVAKSLGWLRSQAKLEA